MRGRNEGAEERKGKNPLTGFDCAFFYLLYVLAMVGTLLAEARGVEWIGGVALAGVVVLWSFEGQEPWKVKAKRLLPGLAVFTAYLALKTLEASRFLLVEEPFLLSVVLIYVALALGNVAALLGLSWVQALKPGRGGILRLNFAYASLVLAPLAVGILLLFFLPLVAPPYMPLKEEAEETRAA